jgi:hypothetical protein
MFAANPQVCHDWPVRTVLFFKMVSFDQTRRPDCFSHAQKRDVPDGISSRDPAREGRGACPLNLRGMGEVASQTHPDF